MLILRCHGQLRCQHRLRPELKSEMLETRWLSITSTRSCIRIRIRCTCTHAVSVALQLFVLLLFNDGRGGSSLRNCSTCVLCDGTGDGSWWTWSILLPTHHRYQVGHLKYSQLICNCPVSLLYNAKFHLEMNWIATPSGAQFDPICALLNRTHAARP